MIHDATHWAEPGDILKPETEIQKCSIPDDMPSTILAIIYLDLNTIGFHIKWLYTPLTHFYIWVSIWVRVTYMY